MSKIEEVKVEGVYSQIGDNMNVEELVEGHDGYCFEILRVKKWNCENLRLKKLKFGSVIIMIVKL